MSSPWPRQSPPAARPSSDSQGDTAESSPRTSPAHSDDGAHAHPAAAAGPFADPATPGRTPSPPRSPVTPSPSEPLLAHAPPAPPPMASAPDGRAPRAPTRSFSSAQFVSSPLNPRAAAGHPAPYGSLNRSRPGSITGSMHLNRIASEEAYALTAGAGAGAALGPYPSVNSQHRASMVLYRLADQGADDSKAALLPPHARTGSHGTRASVWSTMSGGSAAVSMSADEKYPAGAPRGLVAYAYDPDSDLVGGPPDLDDALHDVREKDRSSGVGMRAVANVGLLAALIVGLLCLFVLYPVLTYVRNYAHDQAIITNIHVNSSGQAPDLPIPQVVDPDTPEDARTRTGYDGEEYTLVFSDEFNTDGRSFYPGDDPYWEAVDLWYWATNDMEWYDPGQVTTKDGKLQITMEQRTNHEGMQYISGMLQSWNKFCFTGGYIEMAISLPGPDSSTTGYWPGAWTMGNLGRPGYGATTDGLWPYSYDSCDVGTFPNQTYKDKSGPPAALHSDASRSKYNYELSWLPGQRLSACTCEGEDHPGPSVKKGRGAPEIDIIEAERNKMFDQVGQVVSQSAQFAPFTHDYLYDNSTTANYQVYDSSITWANSYRGSAVQQAMSSLTRTPEDIFQGSGQRTAIFGFEYYTDPKTPTDGFITWVVDNKPSYRMGAGSMGPDMGDGGSLVGQRLVPEEPMSMVINLGISTNWQKILPETMTFPGIMLVDYVRVYQRKGHENIGCDPKDYPTADYINRHLDAYTNPNYTAWVHTPGMGLATNYPWPKNGLYEGGC